MKKVCIAVLCSVILTSITSGCSSKIVAKFDEYNETFVGISNYDPTYGRAVIEVRSTNNGTICKGKANKFVPAIWNFDLLCSDGRAIKGDLYGGNIEGNAFTSRNETITFTVAKLQSTIDDANRQYKRQVKNKPELDNTLIPMQVHMY